MMTILQFLVACAATLVEKVFMMDQRGIQPEPARVLVRSSRSDSLPEAAPGESQQHF